MLLFFVFASSGAAADEIISVCYNYGCTNEAIVQFSEQQLSTLEQKLKATKSADEERKTLATVIGYMYWLAGQQTPVYADKGGNIEDEAVNGAMDCIDHSTTTTRFFKMLDRRKLLRYHSIKDVVRRSRFLLFEHYSAMIEERPHPFLGTQEYDRALILWAETKSDRYVVDSWFHDNGKPAVILPLDDWFQGAGPLD